MGKEGLVEMKNSMNSEQERLEESSTEEAAMVRTPIPELSMKLWYLPKLELPESGCEMTGATLVLIKPVDGMVDQKRNIDGDLMVGSWDFEGDCKEFSEAVREMIKVKKSYLMTMSSF
ncbi:hypothetical protein CCACVL1_29886 [Corchorus capsularis]|uniref:Uncharacterized protein n=1 Tax=Corchorus capsularis TaxID=210143 RepID=A0A1R3FZL8_COCAP|nr:hypothetical protein CCACVL1_29886 [Corchorus capsularis]